MSGPQHVQAVQPIVPQPAPPRAIPRARAPAQVQHVHTCGQAALKVLQNHWRPAAGLSMVVAGSAAFYWSAVGQVSPYLAITSALCVAKGSDLLLDSILSGVVSNIVSHMFKTHM